MAKKTEEPKADVLLASCIGPGKEYSIEILVAVGKDLSGYNDSYVVMDTVKDTEDEALELGEDLFSGGWSVNVLKGNDHENRIDRISHVRNLIRDYFLRGTWTHLYMHDSDVIPPSNVIDELLKLNAPLASALCPLRNQEVAQLPIIQKSSIGTQLSGVLHDGRDVVAVGMACCLIRRDVLEATKFRTGAELEGHSEDFKFCIDSGHPVAMRDDLTCWHVDHDGTAIGVTRGEPAFGVIYEGNSGFVNNRYGMWTRGVPRHDLTPEQAELLDNEFAKGKFRSADVVLKKLTDVLPKENSNGN